MARDERESLLDDELGPSPLARIAVGCAVGGVALLLLIGALGIAVGARRRLEGWGAGPLGSAADPADPPVQAPEPPVIAPAQGPRGAPGAGPAPIPAGRSAMRDRYRPGPFVTVESMVESGRLFPALTAGGAPAQRTVDTPWFVPGAELRPGPMPAPSAGGPSVFFDPSEPTTEPLTVLPRTPARALFRARDASDGAPVAGYLVDFEGFRGHFWLPATVLTELGVVQAGGSDGATVYFAIQSPVMSNGVSLQPGQSFPATLRVAAVDARGRVSAPVERRLDVMSVGAGDVEVTLTMGEATDLDLYVTDPAGVLIYFGNTSSFSGGHLDLDANAACSSNMGRNNEHIFWATGGAPVGTYRVHVAHYQSCIAGRPVSYRITIRACGETVVLRGGFAGPASATVCRSPDASARSWCQEVVQFDMSGCAPL